MARNQLRWRSVTSPQTEHGERFVIARSIEFLSGVAREPCPRPRLGGSKRGPLSEGNGQHSKGRIEEQREMRRTGATEPKVLALARFAAVAIESAIGVIRQSFRHEQLAVVKRPERNRTARIRAFLQHSSAPHPPWLNLGQRRPRTVQADDQSCVSVLESIKQWKKGSYAV